MMMMLLFTLLDFIPFFFCFNIVIITFIYFIEETDEWISIKGSRKDEQWIILLYSLTEFTCSYNYYHIFFIRRVFALCLSLNVCWQLAYKLHIISLYTSELKMTDLCCQRI